MIKITIFISFINTYINKTYINIDGPLINCGADFGLMPSKFEPGGIVQHEFFVASTPVIAFRTGGLKDTVFEYIPKTKVKNAKIFFPHFDLLLFSRKVTALPLISTLPTNSIWPQKEHTTYSRFQPITNSSGKIVSRASQTSARSPEHGLLSSTIYLEKYFYSILFIMHTYIYIYKCMQKYIYVYSNICIFIYLCKKYSFLCMFIKPLI